MYSPSNASIYSPTLQYWPRYNTAPDHSCRDVPEAQKRRSKKRQPISSVLAQNHSQALRPAVKTPVKNPRMMSKIQFSIPSCLALMSLSACMSITSAQQVTPKPQRYELSVRACEIDPRVKSHPEINFQPERKERKREID